MVGLTINLNGELQRLRRQVKSFGQKGLPAASRKAINTAGKAARKVAIKEVADARNIKKRDATAGIKLLKVTARGRAARLHGRGSMIPLFNVKGAKRVDRRPGGGVRVKTSKTGSGTLVKGAFLATVGGSHRGIFKRKGSARLPIKELTLPSIAHTLLKREVLDKVLDEFAAVLKREQGKALNFEIRKARVAK